MPLPDFVIVGAQKAGTSSIFRYLCGLPAVAEPRRKEIHFFDKFFDRGVGWYRDQFPPFEGQAEHRAGSMTGEATPYYLFHPLALERMREVVPDTKVIVLLRDPRRRAVSHYWHEVRLGFEDLSLEEALARETERLEGEEERIRADPTYPGFAHQHFSYQARGRYPEQLQRLFALFPREQVVVLRLESMIAAPDEAMSILRRFLDLPETEGPVVLPAVNPGNGEGLSPAAAAVLDERFAGWSEAVEAVLHQT